MAFFNTSNIGTGKPAPITGGSRSPGAGAPEAASNPDVGLGQASAGESVAARHERLYPVRQYKPIANGAAMQPALGFLKDTKPSVADLASTPAVRRDSERERKAAMREVIKKDVTNRLIKSDLTTNYRLTGLEFVTSRMVTPNRPLLNNATRILDPSPVGFRAGVSAVSRAIPSNVLSDAISTPASVSIAPPEPETVASSYDNVADVITDKAAAQKSASTPGPSKKTVWVTAALVAVAIFVVARR